MLDRRLAKYLTDGYQNIRQDGGGRSMVGGQRNITQPQEYHNIGNDGGILDPAKYLIGGDESTYLTGRPAEAWKEDSRIKDTGMSIF